jgi:YggT family protein
VRIGANIASMGVQAANGLVLDAEQSLMSFVNVFVGIYILFIFAWVLLSWIRLPYSRTTAAVQEFLNEVVRPYIRLFRWLPTLGPFDLSPIVAVVVLLVAAGLVNALIGAVL